MIDSLTWPFDQLHRGFSILAETDIARPPESPACVPEWLEWAASRSGAISSTGDYALADLETRLSASAPAVVETGGRYLLIRSSTRRRLEVLTPELKYERIAVHDIAAAIRTPFEAAIREKLTPIVAGSGISRRRQKRALAALLAHETGTRRFRSMWTFELQPRPGLLAAFREADGPRQTAGLLACHGIQYLLWLAAWAVLGSLSFSGHMDKGWLQAWALLLISLIPFRLLTTWAQGSFAIGLGAMLRRRLLIGALRLQPDEVRTSGIGTFLGQAFEAEAIEALAISGGVSGLLAAVEMIPALFVLGRFAPLLAAWCAVACYAGWHFCRCFRNWTSERMTLTGGLVEHMVGHRTRLAQQKPQAWHELEDSQLKAYLTSSQKIDRSGSWLVAAVPRIWLLLGLATLAPSLTAGAAVASQTAVLLGGVLLAYSALQRLVAGFADVAGAITGWQRVKPLLVASSRGEAAGAQPVYSQKSQLPNSRFIELDRLTYRYPRQAAPAIQNCSLDIHSGDRILLEGSSGGGKTTLANILTGLRQPDSGLLLIDGLDPHSLGAIGWRKRITSAPQFHENHILTGTLAFNLLMGRPWPLAQKDLDSALEICIELGLGDLIQRMPSGLMQMVGEGGWQLSHGEKSRIFLARALLQHSDLIVLDESFAALDPENLQTAMNCTFHRAKTLVVIAHP
jgi:ATP-binding cassette subfamily B protein